MGQITQPMRFRVDINNGLFENTMRASLMQGDKNANRIIVEIMDGPEEVDITGAAVEAKMTLPGKNVTLHGESEGNEAIVLLDESCYSVPGRYELRVSVTIGGAKRTVLFISGNIENDGEVEIESDGGGAEGVILQSKSVAPSETAQTVQPDSGYDGLSSVSVSAISRTYVGSGVTRKAAATITPGTSDQSIAAGQYLSGKQTIKGDADLIPGNIRSGVEIFGVTGTYAASGGTAQPVLQEKNVTPSAAGSTVTPDDGYDGLSAVYVRGDADLVASNIKSGVNIFGVTGTYGGDSTGGNLPSGISALASGVLTPETDINEAYAIEHDLGAAPNFFTFILMDTLTEAVPNMAISGVAYKKDGLPTASNLMTVEYYGATGSAVNRRSGSFLSTESVAFITTLSADTVLKAGYSYRWVAGVMDGIG